MAVAAAAAVVVAGEVVSRALCFQNPSSIGLVAGGGLICSCKSGCAGNSSMFSCSREVRDERPAAYLVVDGSEESMAACSMFLIWLGSMEIDEGAGRNSRLEGKRRLASACSVSERVQELRRGGEGVGGLGGESREREGGLEETWSGKDRSVCLYLYVQCVV